LLCFPSVHWHALWYHVRQDLSVRTTEAKKHCAAEPDIWQEIALEST